MAEVWLAWDEHQGRDVALKLLVPQVALDEEGINRFRVRFQREADAIRRLDSPHIVRLIDFGDASGELYMALSFVDGKPLSATLRDEGMQHPNRVREIARQMAVGLQAAHQEGVLHRDLKPANVMLTRTAQGRDHVVLVDFGIAHVLRSATGETLTRITSEGSMIGTPRYLPPEYIRGEQFDARSDLFSLGLILYEMLEGEAAVGGQDTVQIIARHLDKSPFRLRPEIAQRDPGMANIVHRLLAKRPEDRLQSAAELHQALLDGDVAPPRDDTYTVEAPLAEKEEGLDIATVAAAIFILFVAIAAGFFLFGPDTSSDLAAVETTRPADVEEGIGSAETAEHGETGESDEGGIEFGETEVEPPGAAAGAIDEARYEMQMALLDAVAAARPKAELDEDADKSKEIAGEPEKEGLRLKLPDNEAMNEVRKYVPKLTVE